MFGRGFTILFMVLVLVVLPVSQVNAQYVENGLIAYWSFDANTIKGDTVNDVSGNNNNGTANFPIKTVAGKIGDAMEFDGVNDHYVKTELMIGSEVYEKLTMMAWAKPYQEHEAWGSVMNCDDGGWDRGFGYRNDTWEIQVGHGGDWQAVPGDVSINDWQHVVVIYTPDNVVFYKNGERFEFGEAATPTTTTNPLIIGDDIPCGPNCSFPGAIDEVLIYSRDLSDAEVQQNYTATVPSSLEPGNKLTITWGQVKGSK